MARTLIDENSTRGLLVTGSATGAVVILEGDETTKGLGVHVVGDDVGHGVTGIGNGVKTVTTAGDHEAIASTTTAKEVTVQAMDDNTGLIAVGATGVDATSGSGTGVILYAGDSITLKCDDLADIFVDATVSGEKVRFLYLT